MPDTPVRSPIDPEIAQRFNKRFSIYRSSRFGRLKHGHLKLLFSKILESYTRKTSTTIKQNITLAWGQRINVIYPDTTSIELARYGCYEEGLTNMVLTHVRQGNIFLDVGAHIGYYTLLASWLVGNKGQVHSFEPTPSTFELLQSNTIKNRNVQLNQLALSSSSAEITFNDYGVEHMGSNSRYQPRIDNLSLYKLKPKTIQVAARTLDGYVEEHSINPNFIKIDAESSEYEILKGMTNILKYARPIISIEVGDMDIPGVPSSGELINFLVSKSYQPYEFLEGRFSVHQPKDRYTYDNILFIPET